jgi:hypothetical protein
MQVAGVAVPQATWRNVRLWQAQYHGVGGKRHIEGVVGAYLGLKLPGIHALDSEIPASQERLHLGDSSHRLSEPIFFGTECDRREASLRTGVGSVGRTSRKVPRTTKPFLNKVLGVNAGQLVKAAFLDAGAVAM